MGGTLFGTRVLQLWAAEFCPLTGALDHVNESTDTGKDTQWQELRMTAPPPEPGGKGSPALPQESDASATPDLILGLFFRTISEFLTSWVTYVQQPFVGATNTEWDRENTAQEWSQVRRIQCLPETPRKQEKSLVTSVSSNTQNCSWISAPPRCGAWDFSRPHLSAPFS